MFGENPVRSQELRADGQLRIIDVFPTIQGEGPFSGMAAIFIRLAGCNLRCKWCDTQFEDGAYDIGYEEVVQNKVIPHSAKIGLVVITGGEPLLQNIAPLIKRLVANGFTVQIETAGTVWIDELESLPITFVCSPKTPKVHPKIVAACRDFKYVVGVGDTVVNGVIHTSAATGKDISLPLPKPGATRWIQPRDDHDEAKNAANLIVARDIAMEHGFRLGLQVHKLIGVE